MAEKTTGQWVGAVVGAVVGFFVGDSYDGAMIGAAIGGASGGAIDPPKGPSVTGPRLSDLSGQTCSYGTVLPRTYGTVGIYGNMFWLENNAIKEVSKTESQGGKGGGSSAQTTTYSYYATFAIGLCAGPIVGVRRIWVGSKLIYDASSSDIETIGASAKSGQYWTLYTGTETQMPDDRMLADLGVANCPAFRGRAYIVFKDYPLADHSNSLLGAQVKVEVVNYQTTSDLTQLGYVDVTGMQGQTYSGAEDPIGENNEFIFSRPLGTSSYLSYLYPSGKEKSEISTAFTRLQFTPLYDGPLPAGAMGDTTTTLQFFRAGKYYFKCPGGTNYYWTTNQQSACFYEEGDKAWLFAIRPTGAAGQTVAVVKVLGDITGLAYNVQQSSYAEQPTTSSEISPMVHGGELVTLVLPSTIRRRRLDTLEIIADSTVAMTLGTSRSKLIANGGVLWAFDFNSKTLYEIASDFTLSRSISVTVPGSLIIRNAKFSNGILSAIASSGGGLARRILYKVDRPSPGLVSLSGVIQAECLRSGVLSASDIDLTMISESLRGYRIGSVGTIRSAIEPLQSAFHFDVAQIGYKIKFIPRGNSSVATITEDELDARIAGEASGVRLVSTREMDTQIPYQVTIQYLDADREYGTNEQSAERPNTASVSQYRVDIPIVLTAAEGAGIAETLLYLYWLERENASFILSPEWRHLEPGDVVTIQTTGATRDYRITAIQYFDDMRLQCTAKANGISIYSPSAVGDGGQQGPITIQMAGPSFGILADLPCIVDAMNTPGYGVAACGFMDAWKGTVVYRSDDDGQSWISASALTPPGSNLGQATNVLSAPNSVALIDSKSYLNVSVYNGSLYSVSALQLLNGANHFAVGQNDRWEIVGAQNAVLQADGTYTLSDLLRGRFGTEWAVGTHAIGDLVIPLDLTGEDFMNTSSGTIGLARLYRFVTIGQTLDSADDVSFTYKGVNLECLSPVYLNGSRHPTTNDWTLNWIRRTRIGGEWMDNVDASLGETSESYEIEIYSSVAYTTLKRTITGLSSASCTYSSANQISDFGANQTTLYLKIYQLSPLVGRGYPLTQSISR